MRLLQRLSRLELRTRIILAAALVALIILIYPFQTTVVPEWNLSIRDDDGRPIGFVNVTEHWQHYLLESYGHEEIKQTDEQGRVVFPARLMRASLARRGITTISNLWRDGRSARLGPYASIVIWGSAGHEMGITVYRQGTVPPSEIVIPRLR